MNPYPWGIGHTLPAINLADKKVLWSQKEEQPLDGRACGTSAEMGGCESVCRS